jgi:hypothetical protein
LTACRWPLANWNPYLAPNGSKASQPPANSIAQALGTAGRCSELKFAVLAFVESTSRTLPAVGEGREGKHFGSQRLHCGGADWSLETQRFEP